MSREGFVLAGGGSSRMGRDKALLPYREATLVEHVAAAVEAAAGSATLIGPPERYKSLGRRVAADLRAGCGPLAGIETALSLSRAEWNLVVACDMPGVTEAFLTMLLEAAERSGADCLVPLSDSGPEPLCAAYHRACLSQVSGALDRHARKVTDALAGLRTLFWPAPAACRFDNVNTPGDWEAAAKRTA